MKSLGIFIGVIAGLVLLLDIEYDVPELFE